MAGKQAGRLDVWGTVVGWLALLVLLAGRFACWISSNRKRVRARSVWLAGSFVCVMATGPVVTPNGSACVMELEG
jgi:hypothetical protein